MLIGTIVKNYLKNYLIQVVTASLFMPYSHDLIVINDQRKFQPIIEVQPTVQKTVPSVFKISKNGAVTE